MRLCVEHEPGRFFATVEGRDGGAVDERRGAVLDVRSTYTPHELRGRGIAAQLTEAVLAYAREQGLKILPTCSYTHAYIEQHPQHRGLLP